MAEHVVILLVIILVLNWIRRAGMKTRGKSGIKSYVTKMALRIARKLKFVNSKLESYLETEAAKNTK